MIIVLHENMPVVSQKNIFQATAQTKQPFHKKSGGELQHYLEQQQHDHTD